MHSMPSLPRMRSACLKTWAEGKTSRYLSRGEAGHFWFRGGILEAAYNRLPRFRDNIWPSKPSLLPSPYAQAVSKKLQPRSTANCRASKDSRSSEPLHPLMPQRPWAISLTSNPVRPSLRYFIDSPRLSQCRDRGIDKNTFVQG